MSWKKDDWRTPRSTSPPWTTMTRTGADGVHRAHDQAPDGPAAEGDIVAELEAIAGDVRRCRECDEVLTDDEAALCFDCDVPF